MMRALQDAVGAATAQRQYTAALGALRAAATGGRILRSRMVMDENPHLRVNRLHLPAQLQALSGRGDLSRLPG
jgi:hypothetical protein